MTFSYPLSESINLFVPGRITREDARRQSETARCILKRFEKQPGLILGDEVGMGKTFVALAVAASIALNEPARRPIVIMVPPSLKEKWPRDFQVFTERCLTTKASKGVTAVLAENAVEFLKILDNTPSERASIIFLTHGAMNPRRKLQDVWVKLAIIQRSLYRRHNKDQLVRALGRYAGDLLRKKNLTYQSKSIWEDLLRRVPESWLKVLEKHDLQPVDNDDPVPEAVLRAMEVMDLGDLYLTLKDKIPYRRTKYFKENLAKARETIDGKITDLWKACIHSLKIKLPLLILDEAHHLKNPHTQLSSLFHSEEAEQDADELSRGPMAEVFERMLFLTATPFQLGHYELCSVLDRFTGIAWSSRKAPGMGRKGFEALLTDIREKLDTAQESAFRLDHQWGQLEPDDLHVNEKKCLSTEEWWEMLNETSELPPKASLILSRFNITRQRMREAEESLKPYLIRHSRPKFLCTPFENTLRRLRYPGSTILNDKLEEYAAGLQLRGSSLLPFLLAARVTALKPDKRPVFAEGLASSFEAFLHTREQREERAIVKKEYSFTDGDDDRTEMIHEDSITSWYLNRLETAISNSGSGTITDHPKICATVEKAVKLWTAGEKVLIFCHYIKTGEVLQHILTTALESEIRKIAVRKLGNSEKQAALELIRIGKRFFDKDSPIRRGCDRAVGVILKDFPLLRKHKDKILDVVRRYLRTPSFLARYFPLEEKKMTEDIAYSAFTRRDASGMSLEMLLKDFFQFLVEHSVEDERVKYLDALDKIQPGAIVRLANGQTNDTIRQRLMLAFNTPLYPEILVASMVLAEGVDLHLNCRHVIHHDLCWNPSTLEQRTGRIDRIGAKVERCGQSIQIYLPYIAQTQDEKMYRVVMDRERWFKVVMGESYKVDARTTDKLAERLPLPESAANELIFNLSVASPVTQ